MPLKNIFRRENLSWYNIFTYVLAPLLALFILVYVVLLPYIIWDGFATDDMFAIQFHASFLPVFAALLACLITMIVGLAKHRLYGLLFLFLLSGVWIYKTTIETITLILSAEPVTTNVIIVVLVVANLLYFYGNKNAYL
ncbi:MAG: hypothetical protein PHS79_03435 [Patescibacteria group bacterium]|nr:hypothetical protein [Patescibacteria group bacterium]